MRLIKLFVIFLLFAGLAFAEDAVKEKKVFTAVVDKDGIQRVEVTGGEYFFEPDYIIVKVNMPVEMSVKKVSWVPHDITINAPEAGIDVKESLGKEPKVIKFTPTKTGKYPVYCSKKPPFFKSHREKGMEGMLEVVE